MVTTDRLTQLRLIAEQNRPPPIWVPVTPAAVIEGEIIASTRPMRGSEYVFTVEPNQIDIRQMSGEIVTVQIFGHMARDLALADAGIGSLVHIEYLGKFPGTYGRGKYRRFAIAVLND
ncbi:hypothetical protein CCR95_20910 [Thiocystis minor]|uniref:hypothetical protein n=1 Tax=Thiocystis minor TaxID=61597 RepID=UPI00191183C2|nr:hypothetical protein [Thiocystis minor]MBK5966467.1 hypothetical protein [Thiocystis minor]